MEPIRVSGFSDVLCVWAYIAQVRLEELRNTFGDQVVVEPHFVSIFGHAREKLEARWRDKGGMAAYSRHVREVCERYPHVSVHPDVWVASTPPSSLACHLFLCAIRCCERQAALPPRTYDTLAWALREAFFVEAADISDRAIQWSLLERHGVARSPVEAVIDSGEAFAELSRDLDLARELSVTVSPTLVFNEGRQRLNGNVGYRVIEANIRELLRNPAGELSWC